MSYIARNDDGSWSEPLAMRSMWRDVWDWHKLTDAQRAEHGWYPLRGVNAEFSPSTQTRSAPTYELGGDGVVTATYVVVYDAALAAQSVNAEHDRRALLGRAFPVEGIGDVPLEGSEKTQVVLLALKDTARDLRDAGVTAALLMFTDRDGTDRRMNAVQMIALVNAGKAWMQQVHEAKRALKEMDPIPADFADDRHWPPLA